MAEADLQQFLEKVRQLNAFVALSERQPQLRAALGIYQRCCRARMLRLSM